MSTTYFVVQALKAAKAKVQRGWIQYADRDESNRVCAGQALMDAIHEEIWTIPWGTDVDAVTALLQAAAEQTGISWNSIPEWNDFEGRTQAEVLDTFDHAIKAVEAHESPRVVSFVLPPATWHPVISLKNC